MKRFVSFLHSCYNQKQEIQGRCVGVPQWIRRFFDCQSMIREAQKIDVIPPSREVYGNTFNIAWPSAVESVLVGLVGVIDTMMVGTIGPEAIAAVGITNQPKLIFLAVIMSLNVGVTAVVARKRGEEDAQGANGVLRQSILLSAAFSIVSTIVGVLFAQEIMEFAGAGADILDDATAYFKIIMLGMFFNSLSMTINAAQRGVGRTKIAMRTNLVANGLNVVFNYLLIGGNLGFPRLGVRGAAIATVIGLSVAFLMSVISVLHHGQFLSLRAHGSWRFQGQTMRSLCKVGSSALIEQLCLRFGFFTYAKIVASLGTVAFATHQICMNILSISFSFGDGLSVAASSLVGQSLGAKRADMAIVYGKVCQRMALIIASVLMVCFLFGRRVIMMAFTNDEAVISQGAVIIILIGLICMIQMSQVVIMGCLRGAGDTRFTAAVSLISVAVIRPGSAWLFCYPLALGLMGAWYSLCFDQIIRMVLSMVRFSGGNWTEIKL